MTRAPMLLLLVAACVKPAPQTPADAPRPPTRVLRVLRHRLLLTGAGHDALRVTWTLSRDGDRCALGELTEIAPPVGANGEDDAAWTENERRAWTGSTRSGGRCELTGVDGPLVLRCERAHVPVRPSGTAVMETGRCEPSYFQYDPVCEEAEECIVEGRDDRIRHPLVFADEMIERVTHETTCGYGGGGALRWSTSATHGGGG